MIYYHWMPLESIKMPSEKAVPTTPNVQSEEQHTAPFATLV